MILNRSDVSGFAGFDYDFAVVYCYLSDAAAESMFRAVTAALIAQASAGRAFDSFYPETFAFVQNRLVSARASVAFFHHLHLPFEILLIVQSEDSNPR